MSPETPPLGLERRERWADHRGVKGRLDGEPIGVLLADSTPGRADLVAEVLDAEQDLEVVGRASTASSALDLVGERRPDVVVMGRYLWDVDGLVAARVLKATDEDLAVLMLTSSVEPQLARSAARAGCRGVLRLDGDLDGVADAVRSVGAGLPVFPY